MNNGLSELSKEELLEVVAVQQSQLRQQQQQQQHQQQQLALLAQQRLSGPGSFFPEHRLAQAYGGAGTFSSLLAAGSGLSHLQAPAAAIGAANSGGLVDLLRRRAVATGATDLQETNNSMAELLQAQVARLGSTQAQNPYEAMRQRMLRRELLGGAAVAGSDALASRLAGVNPRQTAGIANMSAASRLGGMSETGRSGERLTGGTIKPSAPTAQDPPTAEDQEAEKTVSKAAFSVVGKKKPKRPLSAYNIFFKEEHAKIIAQTEKEKEEMKARGETVCSDDEYSVDEETGKKRKRSLSTNQPGKRGKRQVDFENLTKVIGRRWKSLPKERVDEYKKRAEEAMKTYRKNLFQKIRNSVQEDIS